MKKRNADSRAIGAAVFSGYFILLILALIFLLFFPGQTDAPETPVTYRLRLAGLTPEEQTRLHPGDRLLDRETHRMLGTVTAVEPLPASTLPLSEAVGDIPGQADVYLTVTAKADRAGHPVVAGRELYPGAALSLSSWDFSGTGTVERVDFS